MGKSPLTLLAAGLLCSASALAEDAPPPPEIDESAIQPRVTIVPGEDQTITEYRLNGQLYMIKIEPVAGPAYYLVDSDGDGRLESRHGLHEELAIPRWVLFSW